MEDSEEEGELAHNFSGKTFPKLQIFKNKTLCQKKPLDIEYYTENNKARLFKPDATCSIRLYLSIIFKYILVLGYISDNTTQTLKVYQAKLKLTFKNTNLVLQFTKQICFFESFKNKNFLIQLITQICNFGNERIQKFVKDFQYSLINLHCRRELCWVKGEAYSHANDTSMFTCGRCPSLTQYKAQALLSSRKKGKRCSLLGLKVKFKNPNMNLQFSIKINFFKSGLSYRTSVNDGSSHTHTPEVAIEIFKVFNFFKSLHFLTITLSKLFKYSKMMVTMLSQKINMHSELASTLNSVRRHIPETLKTSRIHILNSVKTVKPVTNLTFQLFTQIYVLKSGSSYRTPVNGGSGHAHTPNIGRNFFKALLFIQTFDTLNLSERALLFKPEAIKSQKVHGFIHCLNTMLGYSTSHNILMQEATPSYKRESKNQVHYTKLTILELKTKLEKIKHGKLKVKSEECYGTPVMGGSRKTRKPNKGKRKQKFHYVFKLIFSKVAQKAKKGSRDQCKGLGGCQIGAQLANIRNIKARHKKSQDNADFLESTYISMRKQTHNEISYTNCPMIAAISTHTHEAYHQLKGKGEVNLHNHHKPHHTSNPPKKTKWGS